MVGLLCLLLCKSFFSQQRVLHIKPKIPLIVYHTDQGDEDVDVIELGHQGQMSGTREGHWATSDLQPEKLIRPVASVSTSVPHGSADPVHFPNQIPARQCNWLIHRIYQPPPTAPKNNPPLVFNYPSHTPWVKMSDCIYLGLFHQVYYVDFALMLVFTICVLNCLQSFVQRFSCRTTVCLRWHSIYFPLYHITNTLPRNVENFSLHLW